MRLALIILSHATALISNTPQMRARRVAVAAIDDDGKSYEVVGSSTVSLKSQFERALVLQRAGDVDGALDEYRAFIDACEQNDVPAAAYAEVRGNVGALLLKRGDLEAASAELEESVALRDMATTRCNLAIVRMRQSDASGAREHARAALRLADESDDRTGMVARRVLSDVEVLEDTGKAP